MTTKTFCATTPSEKKNWNYSKDTCDYPKWWDLWQTKRLVCHRGKLKKKEEKEKKKYEMINPFKCGVFKEFQCYEYLIRKTITTISKLIASSIHKTCTNYAIPADSDTLTVFLFTSPFARSFIRSVYFFECWRDKKDANITSDAIFLRWISSYHDDLITF